MCKICKSCANGLILANVFRVKVIESNAKYRELLVSNELKRNQERSESTLEEQGNLEMVVESISDDEMQIEVLDEFPIDGVSDKEEEVDKSVKICQKISKKKQKKPPFLKNTIAEVKKNLRLKIIGNLPAKPVQICFICTEPAAKLNPVSPFKETLNRIVSIGDIKQSERLCDRCMQKLKLSKTFFSKLSIAMKRDFSKDSCQFCSCKSNDLLNTSQGPFAIFNALPKIGYESRIYYNGKTCVTCVQILNKIKTIRHSYLSKGIIFGVATKVSDFKPSHKQQLISKIMSDGSKECPKVKEEPKQAKSIEKNTKTKKVLIKPSTKSPQTTISKTKVNDLKERLKGQIRKEDSISEIKQPESTKKISWLSVYSQNKDIKKSDDPKKALISRILSEVPVNSEDPDNDDESIKQIIDSYKDIPNPETSNKRIRIRAEPRYVCPDPNEPLPEDYQCHMSDFEELDSDSEVPPVRFRAPLNVPFTPNFVTCPECNTKFINSFEMEAHIECMHRTSSNVCNICNQNYKDISCVKSHKIGVHFVDFSTFDFKRQCDICGIITKRFDDHMTNHMGTRPYLCQLCSYKGKTKHGLKSHISAIHLAEKRYKCKYCDKGFSYAADRGRHEIGMHTKKFKHICQVCGKCCLKKNFLTAHIRSQHPDEYFEES